MKKIFRVLPIIGMLMLVSCERGVPAPIYHTETICVDGNNLFITTFENDGHIYKEFYRSSGYGLMSIIHDPNCKCHANVRDSI